MLKECIAAPYGGKLVNKYIAGKAAKDLSKFSVVQLSDTALCDLYNIAEGAFSPLTGFMSSDQFYDVIYNNKVNGLPWTIPILIDVEKEKALNFKRGESVVLKSGQGKIAGWMKLKDIYPHKKAIHAKKVFNTASSRHPGVNLVYGMKEYLLGGEVYVFRSGENIRNYLSPFQTREIFRRRKYKTVAGFQTRNVIHRAHEYLQRCALELVDGLFLQPIVGWRKTGDFTAEAVIKAYREFIKDYYPEQRVLLGTLKTAMRYAGPKEAVFHAIIRKNFGCTHFIVGRDHAGVGGYYDKYEAHDIFDKIEEIGITILKFKEPFYCGKCGLIVTEKTCGHHSKHHQEISGTLVRKIIKSGRQPKNKIFRPEVYSLLKREFKRHHLFY